MKRSGVDLAKSVFHVGSRAAERILPPIALWFLVWPLNEFLSLRYGRRNPDHVPAPRLPLPRGSKMPSGWKRWRYHSRTQTHWWLLGWIDRLSAPKWQRRLEVHGLDKLRKELAERPVIVCSVHTTSIPALAAWLRSLGIPAAHVPMDPTWFRTPSRLRKQALAERMGMAYMIRPNQPRDMVKYLTPGRMLVLTADFTGGRLTTVPWAGSTVEVATGMFRMAHATGAAVVPVIIFDTGRWRYEVTILDAVPQDRIEAGDIDAAARHVVDCLMPLAAARPEQATSVLIATIS